MLTWGLLAVGMMFVRTPVQFYLMRFLLGLAEAGFFPGVIYYLTQCFPRRIAAGPSAASTSPGRSARSSWARWPARS